MEFNFEVIYRPGAFQNAPEALPQLPITHNTHADIEEDVQNYYMREWDGLVATSLNLLPTDWD